MRLTPQLIYEAALDDDVFAQLPTVLAKAFDARSCVLHWRDGAGAATIFAHSQYYTDTHLADYAANYVEHDLWTLAGASKGCANRAWSTADLVDEKSYGDSIFYNEWIRGMGDDTYHCLGSVLRTAHGDGALGIHRGKGDRDFDTGAVARLNAASVHLRRMFEIRARIATVEQKALEGGPAFRAGRHPSLVIAPSRRARLANDAAEEMLRRGGVLVMAVDGRVCPARRSDAAAFERCLDAALDTAQPLASSCLLGVEGGCWVAFFTPLSGPGSAGSVLVTLEDRTSSSPQAVVENRLRERFGLTRAEAEIAVEMAAGSSIREIAQARHSTEQTVRFQVKTLMGKMEAIRQSQVAAAVTRLA